MHYALENITDAAVLRRMVAHNLERIAALDSSHAVLEEQISRHAVALRERDAEIARRDREIGLKSARIEQLTHLLAVLRRMQFAARSERLDPAQQALFEQVTADIAAVETELGTLTPPPASPARESERRIPRRQPLPADLPRIEERIEPASCTCGECGGALHAIGEDVSEKLDIKPLEFFVRRTIRTKYACRACQMIVTAPSLPAIIERGIAAPGLLAHVLVSKYADHIPLYRQIGMLSRSGVDLSTSTLSAWVGACGVALQPLVDALRRELNESHVVHADETPLKLLDPGHGKTRTAYLFAYRSGAIGAKPIVVFDFATSRSGSNARRFLEHYGGALVVDDYAGYKQLFQKTPEREPLREVACWAHARRKFFELNAANKSLLAVEALTRIAALYAVEREAEGQGALARREYRQAHARPKVEELFAWLTALRPTVNSAAASARAIDYLLRRKKAFTAYLDDGSFPIDNNPIENAIRPIALGRKNWLFAGSELAGMRAANIMSLIQTAKANGHDPHAWLRDVLTRLPTHLNSRIDELLPHTWQPQS